MGNYSLQGKRAQKRSVVFEVIKVLRLPKERDWSVDKGQLNQQRNPAWLA